MPIPTGTLLRDFHTVHARALVPRMGCAEGYKNFISFLILSMIRFEKLVYTIFKFRGAKLGFL